MKFRGYEFYRGFLKFGIPCGVFLLVIIFFCFNVFATDYFVKNGGSDSNTGLSDAQAWATLSKIQSSTFSAGDNIYLNRGDTWAEALNFPSSGANGNPITITNYGTRDLPQIEKINFFAPSSKSWVNIDGIHFIANAGGCLNYEASNNMVVKNSVLDGNGVDGVVIWVHGKTTTYSYNISILDNIIKNGGVSGSGTNGLGVQCSSGSRDVLVEGNTVFDCEEAGIQMYSDDDDMVAYNLTARDNEVYWTTPQTREGTGGINIGWLAYGCIIERNYVHDCKVGIGIDSNISGENIVRNNKVYNAVELCIVLANSVGNSDNSKIINNTFIAGSNTVKGVWFRTIGAVTGTGHIFKNNIIDGTNGKPSAIFREELIIEDGMIVDSNYNCIYDSAGELIDYQGTTYTDDFATYQSATGQDANSIAQDPLLSDNFSIPTNSPAKDAGVTIASISDDFRRLGRPQGDFYDIGAMEFGSLMSFEKVNLSGVNVD